MTLLLLLLVLLLLLSPCERCCKLWVSSSDKGHNFQVTQMMMMVRDLESASFRCYFSALVGAAHASGRQTRGRAAILLASAVLPVLARGHRPV